MWREERARHAVPLHGRKKSGGKPPHSKVAWLAKLVFRLWGDARGVAKEFHETVALGFSRTLLEKVSSRLNHTHFFRDGGSNPLVQGHAVLFRKALGRFLDGM